MLNSIYAAGSGMQVNLSRLDIVSNNTANMDSPGYKKAIAVTSSFAQELERSFQGKPAPDQTKVGTYLNDIKTDFSDGSMFFTGSDTDLCIGSSGFFSIQTPDGVGYTRNGSFATNADGILVTKTGYPVMGTRGTIHTGGYKTITISDNGTVQGDGQTIDQLLIADMPKPYQMIRTGGSLFYPYNASNAQKVDNPVIKQYYLESSNVNAVTILTEMIAMIDTNRQFEANQKVITTQDSILGRTISEMARL